MNQTEKEKHFWNNYLSKLSEFQIKSDLYPWYVRHCEVFIRENTEIKLKQHTDQSVSSYLEKLINSSGKAAWQKKQAIDALSLLFLAIRAPLYNAIDWQYWKSSCVDLPPEHDTHYRSTHSAQLNNPSLKANPVMPVQASFNKEIDQLRIAIRRKNNSIRTEKSYTDWTIRFFRFLPDKSVEDISPSDVVSFLEHLAIQRGVAPKTQSSALNALSYYFKQVREQELGDISHFIRAKPRQKLPVILTRQEVGDMLNALEGIQWLVVSLLYGAGLRIMEAMRLRAQDIDFGFNQIIVREGKGNKERVVPLPARLITPLKEHLTSIKQQHDADLEAGYGGVFMPPGLQKKYAKSNKQWVWQYVFPSKKLSVDPRSGIIQRHHINESTIQKRVRTTARDLKINKRVTCHTFRHRL
jgi:integron integrase